jgi:hypothetical protein
VLGLVFKISETYSTFEAVLTVANFISVFSDLDSDFTDLDRSDLKSRLFFKLIINQGPYPLENKPGFDSLA